MMRCVRTLGSAVIALAAITARAAIACGALMPAVQIPPSSVDDTFGLNGLAVGVRTSSLQASTSWWTFVWFNAADATDVAFKAHMIDLSGAALSSQNGQWATVTQTAPGEIDVLAHWYATEAGLGGQVDVFSGGPALAVRMAAVETLNVYFPGGQLRATPFADFVLSTEPVPPSLPDMFENVFCTGFDEKK